MVVEEAAELIKAIQKWKRNPVDREGIAEEAADLEIMLGQLKYMIGGWGAHRMVKLLRLKERLDFTGEPLE